MKDKLIRLRIFVSIMVFICSFSLVLGVKAQQAGIENNGLSLSQKSIIKIASLTAKGDLDRLKVELNSALDAGLTLNETKEVLVHTYAYCGFPRSIRGLQTLMEVVKVRQEKGIETIVGRDATLVQSQQSRYNRGKTTLAELTQAPQPDTLLGYAAFAPVIDTFLKEHLFADIFERDILSYAQRELVTISVIATIGQAEPMLKSHLDITLKTGITPNQLEEFVVLLKSTAGKNKSRAAGKILQELLQSNPTK